MTWTTFESPKTKKSPINKHKYTLRSCRPEVFQFLLLRIMHLHNRRMFRNMRRKRSSHDTEASSSDVSSSVVSESSTVSVPSSIVGVISWKTIYMLLNDGRSVKSSQSYLPEQFKLEMSLEVVLENFIVILLPLLFLSMLL